MEPSKALRRLFCRQIMKGCSDPKTRQQILRSPKQPLADIDSLLNQSA
jgi:hypothetical protein